MSDLDDVRELRAQVEPTDVAVARIRHRVLSTLDTPAAGAPGRRRVLQVVAACAAVAVVMGGVAVGIHNSLRPDSVGVGVPSPSPTPAKSPGRVPPRPSPSLPPGGHGSLVDMSVTPVVIPPGAYLYVKQGVDEGNQALGEDWYDPNGFIRVCVIETYQGQQNVLVSPSINPSGFPDERTDFAQAGPSLRRPTPAFLAALPTDRASLWTLIREQMSLAPSGDHQYDKVFKNLSEILPVIEPVLSPAVRAAILDALAHAPGATADHTPRTYDGHQVYLVGETQGDGVAFAVDTTTGRILGPASFSDASFNHIEYAVVAQPCQRP